MKRRLIGRLFLFIILIIQPIAGFAFETDQFNLPPTPLADIGDEVSEYTEENLVKAVNKINAEISALQMCLEKKIEKAEKSSKIKCGAADETRKRLEYLRSEAALAREVFKLLGDGIVPFTKSGTWMNSHRFRAQPARYKTGYRKSIFAVLPTNYLTISPTVKIYGAQFGTDKIAHFFQQGYTYYRIFERASAQGLNSEKAAQKAIKWGQKTERTYYGTLISGVYSNADLFANFVGMKFYQGLAHPVKIGDAERPAIVSLKNGFWKFNENADLRQILVKPFMTDHMNEALNPSIYTGFLGFRGFIRRSVKKNACRQWMENYPDQSEAEFDENSQKLKLWFGEDYGFTESENFITLSNACFNK
jgi:hypothetical protein